MGGIARTHGVGLHGRDLADERMSEGFQSNERHIACGAQCSGLRASRSLPSFLPKVIFMSRPLGV